MIPKLSFNLEDPYKPYFGYNKMQKQKFNNEK